MLLESSNYASSNTPQTLDQPSESPTTAPQTTTIATTTTTTTGLFLIPTLPVSKLTARCPCPLPPTRAPEVDPNLGSYCDGTTNAPSAVPDLQLDDMCNLKITCPNGLTVDALLVVGSGIPDSTRLFTSCPSDFFGSPTCDPSKGKWYIFGMGYIYYNSVSCA